MAKTVFGHDVPLPESSPEAVFLRECYAALAHGRAADTVAAGESSPRAERSEVMTPKDKLERQMAAQGNRWRQDFLANDGQTVDSVVARVLALSLGTSEGPQDWGMNTMAAAAVGFPTRTGRDNAASFISSYICGPLHDDALYALVNACTSAHHS